MVALRASSDIPSLWFLLTWCYAYDLADEGFYWHGAERALLGKMTIRDLNSHHTGRSYRAVGVMSLLGDESIYGARMATAAYQAVNIVHKSFLQMKVVA